MSTPIERIAGYACEVNEEQWRELVKVADEVGIGNPNPEFSSCHTFAFVDKGGDLNAYDTKKTVANKGLTLIPYRDFLAKLKGEVKWEPKNGEEVEVCVSDKLWVNGMFISMDGKWYVCRVEALHGYYGVDPELIRPLRPTITRAEAEQKLKELGVIARIVY